MLINNIFLETALNQREICENLKIFQALHV